LKPPMRVCTSHMPDGFEFELPSFHSMRVAPAVGPWVEMMRSCSSAKPVVAPVLPTCSTGLGELIWEKKLPEAMMMVASPSPTTRVLGGT